MSFLRTMKKVRWDFAEMLTAELISTMGGIAAGGILAFALDKLELIPALFVFLPGFLEMRGSISGSLSARLSAALHVGALKPEMKHQRILHGNIVASFLLVVIVSLILGIVAYLAGALIFGTPEPKVILVVVLAAVMANLVEIPSTILVTFWLYKRGYDPNNIMGPYISTVGDFISTLALVASIVVVSAVL